MCAADQDDGENVDIGAERDAPKTTFCGQVTRDHLRGLEWERLYTAGQWLDQVPTFGGHSQFPAATLEQLLDGIAAAINAIGGRFTMPYATVAVTARRRPDPTCGM